MKIKDGFVLREVAGNNVVVGVGKTMQDFNGVLTWSGSGTLLWKKLETGADEGELLDLILSEYDIDSETAKKDIDAFLDKIRGIGLLEE